MAKHYESEAGFSLLEVLVSVLITTLIMGGTFSAMSQAMKAQESAKLVLNMNGNLRVTMDLVVRDFIQVGQGLPTGKTIQIPNSNGATTVVRPGPTTMDFGTDTPMLSAITVGANLGPAVSGQPTDMITLLAADGSFDDIGVMAIKNQGASFDVFIDSRHDITAGHTSDIKAGDLIMLVKGSASTLLQVSAVSDQKITFTRNDSLRLNQFKDTGADASESWQGTINQLMLEGSADLEAPAWLPSGLPKLGATRASRIRMLTYYIDSTTDAQHPRLMRILNGGTATPVGLDIENLQLTYDIANSVTNPANVHMDADDLSGAGKCSPDPCSPNQIRKINVVLAARSNKTFAQTKRPFRNALFSQVSTRSLAFVDQYR